MLSPPTGQLEIEVVFDLVCPWCFLGIRRLRRALQRRPDIHAELRWRPFLLNPDNGGNGPQRQESMLRKFGGEERARRLNATLAELGKAEGISFRFDLMRRVPPSVDAHRLVRFAAQHGMAAPTVDLLFEAHFTQGQDIADPSVLARLAVLVGLEREAAWRFLVSGLDADAVHAENLRAHRLGINGVPCFVMSGRHGAAGGHAIAGAQEPEVLERLMDVALAEAAEF
ncbi:DsbA family oxidoreductase [Roseomonas marmotae]|uniref:DsbA family oxidoreductase n=1 Tax=Roseomonas marmotae TaxID=2768161 RepID=A0ABS3KCZ9_9PROT|nr:DsbA family oxidoreductase [Roseomonas marmotae]QTI80943.1 DsbA family oxidoreductase [Roseomonas marmotae]